MSGQPAQRVVTYLNLLGLLPCQLPTRRARRPLYPADLLPAATELTVASSASPRLHLPSVLFQHHTGHGSPPFQRRPPLLRAARQNTVPAKRYGCDSHEQRCHPSATPKHVVMVSLRCGKAGTETPRPLLVLNSSFPHISCG